MSEYERNVYIIPVTCKDDNISYEIHVTHEQVKAIVSELFGNFPEASVDGFVCYNYSYTPFQFDFEDDDGKQFTVRLVQACEGWVKFAKAVMSGELPGLGITNLFDLGNYDGYVVWTLAQYCVYGEAVYG